MDLIGEERTAVARAAAWLDATRAELVGLTVLLVGATLATAVLLWQALGRPDLPATAVSDPSVATAADAGTDAGAGAGTAASGGQVDPHGGGHGGHAGDGGYGGGGHAAAGGDAPDGDPPGGEASEVTVHVAGHVAEPGVVTLPAGARVAAALEAAGGATAEADLSLVNLARVLGDGEHVRIVAEGEEPPDPPPDAAGTSADPAADGSGEPGRIDLNRASTSELETLPGIGPAIAARIVEHRERHGPFRTPGDLRDVSGIGERRFQDIADRVEVG